MQLQSAPCLLSLRRTAVLLHGEPMLWPLRVRLAVATGGTHGRPMELRPLHVPVQGAGGPVLGAVSTRCCAVLTSVNQVS